MKVSVTVTVDLDPADWTMAFGVEGDAEIRQEVKDYIGNIAGQSGVFGNGEVVLRSWKWR
jgi:hypothetical protein